MAGDSTVKATAQRQADVHVPDSASLMIFCPGSLDTQGYDGRAGIGGGRYNSVGGGGGA